MDAATVDAPPHRTAAPLHPAPPSPSSSRPSATANAASAASPNSASKISCLACRAAKRKCITAGVTTVCKRCHIQRILCEYKQHRRGRTKKIRAPSDGGPIPQEDAQRNSTAASGFGQASNASASSASPALTGIRFSHVIPDEGDSTPYMPNSRSHDAIATASSSSIDERVLLGRSSRDEWPDPVTAGILSEADAYELFDYYFLHLNITLALLDPGLHTVDYCRSVSSLLYTAVLTVTAKIVRPEAYSPCVVLSNRLLGQAFEHALCSVELIQSINLLTHWRKADDTSSFRRIGYAIRMAQELRLHVKAPRPLPSDEQSARIVLNKERAWINLIVADYHLAIHHSLPKMIGEDDIDDPVEWIAEHSQFPCPGEAMLAPMLFFCRMVRLYMDMLLALNAETTSLKMLEWIEMQWKHWRKRWILDERRPQDPEQVSTLQMSDKLFHFHLCEYRLLFTARYRSNGVKLDTTQPTKLLYSFGECVEAALGIIDTFLKHVVQPGFLPYCFHLTWVAIIIASIWLIKNMHAIQPNDRPRAIRMLSNVKMATEEASRSSDDMSAYTSRLLEHLLGGLSPEWHLNCLAETAAQTSGADVLNGSAEAFHMVATDVSNIPSTHQMIQDHLWNPPLTMSNPVDPYISEAIVDFNPQDDRNRTAAANPAMGLAAPHSVQGVPTSPQVHLFPAADDDFWRMLFPRTSNMH
ncbi:hypothetical protein ACQY0O_005450 [Thecaphora frezii]